MLANKNAVLGRTYVETPHLHTPKFAHVAQVQKAFKAQQSLLLVSILLVTSVFTAGGALARSFTETNVLFGIDLPPCLELGSAAFIALRHSSRSVLPDFSRLHYQWCRLYCPSG